MPRNARQLSSSKTYHIMIRGNEKRDIFMDDQDRYYFLDILRKKRSDKNSFYIAYCLMNNHIHLLINEGNDEISKIMKRINVSYVYYFNKKYNRVGHLFQDRFRSEIIEDDVYLLAAARYIHNNPVKVNIVANPEDYAWSSYRIYMGQRDSRNLINRDYLLGFFANDERISVSQLATFTNQPTDDVFIDLATNIEERDYESEIIREINKILKNHSQSIESLQSILNKSERDAMIKEIKLHTGASTRQLSKILGISKDIIFRA